jgi:hypothetical protein
MKKLLFSVIVFILIFASNIYSQNDPTVYVTRTGSKYHSAGCSYLRKSSIPMKLSEASKQYSPCSRCNPPVLNSSESKLSSSNSQNVSKTSRVESSEYSKQNSDPAVGNTATGKTIYEGPRGGHYHYSKSGKKVYERKKY